MQTSMGIGSIRNPSVERPVRYHKPQEEQNPEPSVGQQASPNELLRKLIEDETDPTHLVPSREPNGGQVVATTYRSVFPNEKLEARLLKQIDTQKSAAYWDWSASAKKAVAVVVGLEELGLVSNPERMAGSLRESLFYRTDYFRPTMDRLRREGIESAKAQLTGTVDLTERVALASEALGLSFLLYPVRMIEPERDAIMKALDDSSGDSEAENRIAAAQLKDSLMLEGKLDDLHPRQLRTFQAS